MFSGKKKTSLSAKICGTAYHIDCAGTVDHQSTEPGRSNNPTKTTAPVYTTILTQIPWKSSDMMLHEPRERSILSSAGGRHGLEYIAARADFYESKRMFYKYPYWSSARLHELNAPWHSVFDLEKSWFLLRGFTNDHKITKLNKSI